MHGLYHLDLVRSILVFAIVVTSIVCTTVSVLYQTCIYVCTDCNAQHGEIGVSQLSTQNSSDSVASGKNNAAEVSTDELSGNSSKVYTLY